MPLGVSAYIPLATETLAANAASINFAAIPATYRDLILVMRAGTTSNSNNIMRFNSDSGSNYSGLYMTGNGSVATSGGAGGTFAQTDSSAFTTTVVGDTNNIIQILDYSATDKHKVVLVRANRAGGAVDAMTFRWASTSALTSITLTSNGGFSWLSGSTFALYGIPS
jgi:hypothetical protein